MRINHNKYFPLCVGSVAHVVDRHDALKDEVNLAAEQSVCSPYWRRMKCPDEKDIQILNQMHASKQLSVQLILAWWFWSLLVLTDHTSAALSIVLYLYFDSPLRTCRSHFIKLLRTTSN